MKKSIITLSILAVFSLQGCGGEPPCKEPAQAEPTPPVVTVTPGPIVVPTPAPTPTPTEPPVVVPTPTEPPVVVPTPVPIPTPAPAPTPTPTPTPAPVACSQLSTTTYRLQELSLAYQNNGYVYLYSDGTNLGPAAAFGAAVIHFMADNVWHNGACPSGSILTIVAPYPPIHPPEEPPTHVFCYEATATNLVYLNNDFGRNINGNLILWGDNYNAGPVTLGTMKLIHRFDGHNWFIGACPADTDIVTIYPN